MQLTIAWPARERSIRGSDLLDVTERSHGHSKCVASARQVDSISSLRPNCSLRSTESVKVHTTKIVATSALFPALSIQMSISINFDCWACTKHPVWSISGALYDVQSFPRFKQQHRSGNVKNVWILKFQALEEPKKKENEFKDREKRKLKPLKKEWKNDASNTSMVRALSTPTEPFRFQYICLINN